MTYTLLDSSFCGRIHTREEEAGLDGREVECVAGDKSVGDAEKSRTLPDPNPERFGGSS